MSTSLENQEVVKRLAAARTGAEIIKIVERNVPKRGGNISASTLAALSGSGGDFGTQPDTSVYKKKTLGRDACPSHSPRNP